MFFIGLELIDLTSQQKEKIERIRTRTAGFKRKSKKDSFIPKKCIKTSPFVDSIVRGCRIDFAEGTVGCRLGGKCKFPKLASKKFDYFVHKNVLRRKKEDIGKGIRYSVP